METRTSAQNRFAGRLFGLLAVIIGTSVVIGWEFNIAVLKSMLPELITMKANTALGLIIFGVLALTSCPQGPLLRRLPFILFNAVPFLIGSLTLCEYVFDIQLGIDEFLFSDPDGLYGKFPPGRLAPATAACFILISTGLALCHAKGLRAWKSGQFLILLAFLISFQCLVGYMLGMSYTFGAAFYTQMALHTAISFSLVTVAHLLVNSRYGLMSVFSSNTIGGKITRDMILAAVLIPPFVSWLLLKGQNHGWYDEDFGTLLKIIANVTLFSALAWRGAFALQNADLKRRSAEFEKELLAGKMIESNDALRESEKSLRSLTEALPQLIFSTSTNGDIEYCNTQALAYAGITQEELFRIGWKSLIQHEDRLQAFEKIMTSTKEGSPAEIEFRLRRGHDGSYRWFLARLIPVRNHKNEIVKWLVSATDIHDHKMMETERALLIAREQGALGASRMKSEFIANMSHEIRTPINGVIGMAGLLLDTPLTAVQREYAAAVSSSASLLLGIVNDILDLSKIEAGKMEFEEIEFDPKVIIEETKTFFSRDADAKSTLLTTEVDQSVPHVLKGDPGRLRQVLNNLMGNALKFTSGGHVRLRVTVETSTSTDALLKFEVSDTGIGIAPDALKLLFQPFSQADSSTTRKFGGTGLGLSICKLLVENMQGRIGVTSRESEGSTFWFTAQLKRVETSAIQSKAESSREDDLFEGKWHNQGYRVLIAEDNIVNQKIAVKQLEKMGLHADAVANGLEALESLNLMPYDLVLMDCQMPELDGYETTLRIRKSKEAHLAQLPIIAMTANAFKADQERCFAVGMNDYVAKPVSLAALGKKISKWLPPCHGQIKTG